MDIRFENRDIYEAIFTINEFRELHKRVITRNKLIQESKLTEFTEDFKTRFSAESERESRILQAIVEKDVHDESEFNLYIMGAAAIESELLSCYEKIYRRSHTLKQDANFKNLHRQIEININTLTGNTVTDMVYDNHLGVTNLSLYFIGVLFFVPAVYVFIEYNWQTALIYVLLLLAVLAIIGGAGFVYYKCSNQSRISQMRNRSIYLNARKYKNIVQEAKNIIGQIKR